MPENRIEPLNDSDADAPACEPEAQSEGVAAAPLEEVRSVSRDRIESLIDSETFEHLNDILADARAVITDQDEWDEHEPLCEIVDAIDDAVSAVWRTRAGIDA
jgi:hypothetical protein